MIQPNLPYISLLFGPSTATQPQLLTSTFQSQAHESEASQQCEETVREEGAYTNGHINTKSLVALSRANKKENTVT